MKFYILNMGYMRTDKNNLVGCATVGTYDNPHVDNAWIKSPAMAFVIDTGKELILYDTGSHPDAMKGHWPKHLQQTYPMYQKEEERLENQLALIGLKPENINTVILSHMHLDHAGGIYLFPHADVYVPKQDFMTAQTTVHLSSDSSTHGGYVKGDLDVIVKQYHLVENDFEIVPGVEVINLPGHTPGLLGLLIHLDGGSYILPQDSVYTSEIYGPPARMSGLLYDSLSFFKSIEKVRKLEKNYNAKVIFAHDENFVETLKFAPDYYE